MEELDGCLLPKGYKANNLGYLLDGRLSKSAKIFDKYSAHLIADKGVERYCIVMTFITVLHLPTVQNAKDFPLRATLGALGRLL